MSIFEIIIFMKYFLILRFNFLITFFYGESDSKFIKD